MTRILGRDAAAGYSTSRPRGRSTLPADADLVLDTARLSVEHGVDRIVTWLRQRGWLPTGEP